MDGIYELTLRAQDGRERRILAWLPTEACLQDFYDKARRRGLTVTENASNNQENDNDYEQIR